MAGSKADFLENKVLQHVFKSDFAAPATLYLALFLNSDKPTDTNAGTEVSTVDTAYAREAITRNTGWTLTDDTVINAADIEFVQATAEWGELGAFALVSTASGAYDVYYWADLDTPKTITTGDTAKFAAGELTVTEG
jgi:hypothetical protein